MTKANSKPGMPGRRLIGTGIAAGAIGAIAVAIGKARAAPAPQESALTRVLRTRRLTVGTLSGNWPWEFTTPSGMLDGYDIAIANSIGRDLGASVHFIQTSSAGRIPLLQAGKADIVIGELDYTPARAQLLAYTRAYANPMSQFVVRSSSPYQTVESLNDANVTLGYGLGAYEAILWPKMLPKAKLRAFSNVADAEQAMLSGEVTATGEPTVLNVRLMKANPGKLRVLNPPYFKAITCVGLAYGDFDWWLWLDRWVANFNFTGANQALWTKYVGGGSPLLPSAASE